MVRLTGGEFLMGADDPRGFPADGEGPVRRVRVDPFFVGKCAVTNAEFAEFTRETGYVTEAERFGWSFVFHLLVPANLQNQVDQAALIAPVVVEGQRVLSGNPRRARTRTSLTGPITLSCT